MDTEKFIQRSRSIHGETYDYSKSVYTIARAKVIIICRTHGAFKQEAWGHMNGRDCPLCIDSVNSKQVKKIEEWLIDKKILYIREKTFDDLKGKSGKWFLKFDFFLPKSKTLLEYDGEQHHRISPKFKGEKGFKDRIDNDRRKDKWAKENNYKLARISYKDAYKLDSILKSIVSDN
jgi:very-short-patch-repair endonuclease